MRDGKVFLEYFDRIYSRTRKVEILEILDVYHQSILITSQDFPTSKERILCKQHLMIKIAVQEDSRYREKWLNEDSPRAWTKILTIFERVKGGALINTRASEGAIKEEPVNHLPPKIAKILKEYCVGKNAVVIFSGDEIDTALKEAYHSQRSGVAPAAKEEKDEPLKS